MVFLLMSVAAIPLYSTLAMGNGMESVSADHVEELGWSHLTLGNARSVIITRNQAEEVVAVNSSFVLYDDAGGSVTGFDVSDTVALWDFVYAWASVAAALLSVVCSHFGFLRLVVQREHGVCCLHSVHVLRDSLGVG